jgi:CubicO group peptidase (beta-lactamase class C family)
MYRYILPLYLASASLAAQTPAGTPAPSAASPARIERLLRPAVRLVGRADTAFELNERLRYYHVPSVSIAVIDDFKVVFARGYGVKEFGKPAPADSNTLFLAGSISKPVFATGILALVEQGRLGLDDDVNRSLTSWHLPESRFTEREKVTLRRLLTHSAGLTVWGFPGYDLKAPVPTVPQLLDGTKPANTAAVRSDTFPGARWLYSGGGFTIAQLLASDVTGEPFPSLMRRLVLAPTGMTRSTYENPLPTARRGEAASGHETVDTPVPGGFHVYPEMAAAGLWTTASDLARWAISLSRSYRGDTRGPLSPAMARQMVSKQVHQAQQYGGGYWGLGVAVSGDGDSLAFSHGGRDEGFVANVMMWPNRGRGIVILSNGVAGGLLQEIMRGFAEEYRVPFAPRAEKRVGPVDAAAWAGYVGHYAMPAGRDTVMLDVTVDTAAGSLTMSSAAQRRTMQLLPVEGDKFFSLDNGSEWTFERASAAPGAPVRALVTGTGGGRNVALRR